jgi:hypothetical protein
MAMPYDGPLRVTNLPGGLSTDFEYSTLGNYPYPDPTKFHIFWDDFDKFLANATITITDPGNYALLQDWVVTQTGGGTTATAAHVAGDGGLVLFTTDTTENHGIFAQWAGGSATALGNFRWSSTKKMFFCSRFKVSDATQSDIVMGLQIADTTPLDTDDGLFFIKVDGSTSLTFRAEKDDAASTVTAATLANDTYVKVAFEYLPSTQVGAVLNVFVDDVRVGSLTSFTNFPNDVDVTVTFGIENGSTTPAKTMTVDYILAARER